MIWVLLFLFALSCVPLVWLFALPFKWDAEARRAFRGFEEKLRALQRERQRQQELDTMTVTIPCALAEDLKQAAKASQMTPEAFVAQAVQSAVRAALGDTRECTGYNDDPSLELVQGADAPGGSSIAKSPT